MSVSEEFNKSTLTSMKLVELQRLAQTYKIEIKTVSQRTNNKINKKKATLIDEIMEVKKKDDNRYNEIKECVDSYEKENGSDFIKDIIHVKKMNEEINSIINDLKIDEFKDFQPNVYTHELDDSTLSTISSKTTIQQYKFFIKLNKKLKFGDIIILSNNDCEVKKIYHVCDEELAEDISLCDADWMSLGIPKEISKKFENMDELLRIYKNYVIEAFEFSDDYFCVQLESNHPFLKKKFNDIEEKHIEIMKDWDTRYLFEGDSFQKNDNQYDECDESNSVEGNDMKNDFEIITPKTHEKYHCSEYYQRSIKKLIQSYNIDI